jgi:hypothetical protein
MSKETHAPLVPQEEIRSNLHALTLFILMLLKYLVRHLTIGAYIRVRRKVLRKLGRVYYV